MRWEWVKRSAFLLMVAIAVYAGYRFLHVRVKLDPDNIARSETKMWQAYYSGDVMTLGRELVGVLNGQFHISFLKSQEIAKLLAKAALNFRKGEDPESIVMPDLREAYRLIGRATGTSFDPDRVARADLAWWQARRTPGADSSELVGAKIAEYYSAIYGNSQPRFIQAGVLRAQAAQLRDTGGAGADWAKVESLLRQSYSALIQ